MTGLSDEQLEQYRTRLIARRAELKALDEASRESRAAVTLDQQSVGRLSRMDAMQQQAMAEAEARRRVSEIARIDSALKRIEDGDYGWCLECGEDIPAKRLDFDPSVAKCLECSG
ncbi:TraR/DksA C4-type zinc finger protein [Stakelama sediminis]|uniref:DnaK suppressor protein n=1 Tax=Stakelama sediminis TaxID=463200 RepID=A0A840YZC1_9SPHN|nr:TraR/DksA family transcriptional regulator [Stakelama sediminis]MBB5719048.1 DnaK suppressor protein [Stakelama sediminis]